MERKFILKILFMVLITMGTTLIQYTYAQEALFTGGEVTEEDPYLIATAEDLNNIRSKPYAHFKQIEDIDLGVAPWNNGKGWEPIGTWSKPFTGSYKGNSYVIGNLTINRPHCNDYVSLFNSNSNGSKLINVNLEDVNIIGNEFTGSLVGYNDGYISGASATGSVTGNAFVGGLVSVNRDGFIIDSYSNVEVFDIGDQTVGGLASSNSGHIQDSYSEGNVSGYSFVGGLVGSNSNIGYIQKSYATGDVSGYSNVGGLAGQNNGYSVIENSYSSYSLVCCTISRFGKFWGVECRLPVL